MISESKAVPDFELPATGNQRFRLSAFKGHPLLLYFYPKDDTPGCTDEGAQFRDLHGQFVKAGWAVFGVSRDTVASHEKFKAKMGFPFELLADTEEKACAIFDVDQDEEHVRQAGARHRPQHLCHRTRCADPQGVARGEGSRPCKRGPRIREVRLKLSFDRKGAHPR